jgi:hypothetical protein
MQLANQRRRATIRTAASLAGVGAALLAAGCGSSTHTTTGASTQGAAQVQQSRLTASQSNPDVGSGQGQTQVGSRPGAKSVRGTRHYSRPARPKTSNIVRTGKVQKGRATPAGSDDDLNASHSIAQNPCSLVTRAEAQAIIGARITRTVAAPQGPTCIYTPKGSKAEITLAVETMSFAQITRQLKDARSLHVAGRGAYCGKLGTPMLFVALPAGRVLNVTAPCAIARQFAATALGRIAA